tara:strand:- start:23227 stop:23532 length:306 start_codon:yes stop_codon:yes gene_type:complete
MSKYLYDHTGNVTTVIGRDESDPLDSFYVKSVENVAPAIERNKMLQEDVSLKTDYRLVASIPRVIFDKLMRVGMDRDIPRMKKWLDDSDNRVWRIWPGKLK